jgi:succinate dehydrogenase / fumarate reductase membrane anchor subunit
MSKSEQSLRTPLAKVRGLGSAKEGAGHFIQQRVSAVALLILTPWLAISMIVNHVFAGWEAAVIWLTIPWNAVPTALFAIAVFFHMRLGMQVIIEDYIAKPWARITLLIVNTFLTITGALAALYAILQASKWVLS